jgi:hypothetical protein
MKKIYFAATLFLALISVEKIWAQCSLQIANVVITQPSSPQPDPNNPNKCQYTFSFSFDVTTNGGFKYLFFHTWLDEDYPATPVFDCNSNNSQSPGTSAQLGTVVDELGKSFLDLGFLGLHNVSFPANTAVEVTQNLAHTYELDPSVVLTSDLNSSGMQAFITRKDNTNILHFEITNVQVIINKPCGTPIKARTDIWGSNMNPPAPKAQCYLCGLNLSFNEPHIALIKTCDASPYGYIVGITTNSATPLNITYNVYAHDLSLGDFPSVTDQLIPNTSVTTTVSSSQPYTSGVQVLPNPYCCVDPWAIYGIYVKLTSLEFENTFASQIIEPGCAPLPIKLKSFTAARNRSNVTLKWETEIEDNNKGFEIQRLVGNGSWQTVGFVNTSAVNGNSSIPLSYNFTDVNTTRGISQYRLRQVDIVNKYSFSPIRSVRGDGQKLSAIIYPNPSNDGKVNIVFSEAETVRDVSVIDINGRVIRKWKGITDNNLKIENLTPGLYSVRIIDIDSGEQTVEKFVIKNR